MTTETLGAAKTEQLLQPYLRAGAPLPAGMYKQLSLYLDILLKWNARTNLTAVRDPEAIVRRHFGESLYAGQQLNSLGPACDTLLDFGSGAGFPGLPIQLLNPTLKVTVSESQNKKATFLREVVRVLGLDTKVWASRVEEMPLGRQFDVVTMRAVDDMETALVAASARARTRLMLLVTDRIGWKVPDAFDVEARFEMVESQSQHLIILKRRS